MHRVMSPRDAVGRHARFPYRVWVVVEQPRDEPLRIRYVRERGEFVRSEDRSLLFARGFGGAYGWIAGTGEPPGVHYDALVVTDWDVVPGEVVEAEVVGVFLRGDGDHKVLTIDTQSSHEVNCPDLDALPEAIRAQVQALYPRVGEGEGWRGAEEARRLLSYEPPMHV